MKAPAPIPKNIRIIDRESFLASVEKRGDLLLRARTENPNNHLLVICCDAEERYAVVVETGPNADHADLRQASRHAPPGLAVRYIVPCAQCPPYAIPKGLARTDLPATLAPLFAPPEGFGAGLDPEPEAEADAEPEAPVPGPVPPLMRSARSAPPPVALKPNRTLTPSPSPQAAPAPSDESGKPEPAAPPAGGAEPATLAALLSRSLQDLEKSLSQRDADLRRREAMVQEREATLAQDRRLLEEEAGRISAGIENRELTLARRENELQTKAEHLVRAMRELDELRRKVESIATKPFDPDR